MASKTTPSKASAIEQLAEFYYRHGSMRVPDIERRKKESRTYKMGYEVRLVVPTRQELALVRRLLRIVGLKPSRPYSKSNQWCQPIYGKLAIELFTEWLERFEWVEEDE